MNFQQLRFVIALSDTGSFTKAADLCCVSQPALSNGVSQLEDELGAKLFKRTTRSVTQTEFGDVLIDEMRKITKARGQLFSRAADFLTRDLKTIRIGLSPLISSEFVEAMMARIELADDSLTVILSEMNRADIQPGLESGTIDFGLGPKPVANDSFATSTIYSEPLLYISDTMSGDPVEPITLSQMSGQQILLVQDGCGLSATVRDLFRDNQLKMEEYEGRALGYHILEKWARLGIGVTLVPASKVSDVTYARRLDDSLGTSVTITYEASWNKTHEAQANFQTVIKCL